MGNESSRKNLSVDKITSHKKYLQGSYSKPNFLFSLLEIINKVNEVSFSGVYMEKVNNPRIDKVFHLS